MDTDQAITLQIDYVNKLINLAEDLETRLGKWPHPVTLLDWVEAHLSVAEESSSEAEVGQDTEFVKTLSLQYNQAISLPYEQVLSTISELKEDAAEKRRAWLNKFDEPNDEIRRLFEGN